AVGDKVYFETTNKEGVIYQIEQRKNYIIRKSVNLSKQAHIIASNIDQCLLVATISQPTTSTGFIDRFLITAEAYNVPVVLVFNKSDLLSKTEHDYCDKLQKIYTDIGYKCLATSVKSGDGIEDVKKLMKGKINMISGHSGVGKSSLINKIEPSLDLKTTNISGYHHKGQHTTTFA